jgi:hypothetical protein
MLQRVTWRCSVVGLCAIWRLETLLISDDLKLARIWTRWLHLDETLDEADRKERLASPTKSCMP